MPDGTDDDSVGDIWDYAQTNEDVIPLSSSGKFGRPAGLSSINHSRCGSMRRPLEALGCLCFASKSVRSDHTGVRLNLSSCGSADAEEPRTITEVRRPIRRPKRSRRSPPPPVCLVPCSPIPSNCSPSSCQTSLLRRR